LTGNLTVGENYGNKKPGENGEEEILPKNIKYILEDKLLKKKN
jgi:hypothetical protein